MELPGVHKFYLLFLLFLQFPATFAPTFWKISPNGNTPSGNIFSETTPSTTALWWFGRGHAAQAGSTVDNNKIGQSYEQRLAAQQLQQVALSAILKGMSWLGNWNKGLMSFSRFRHLVAVKKRRIIFKALAFARPIITGISQRVSFANAKELRKIPRMSATFLAYRLFHNLTPSLLLRTTACDFSSTNVTQYLMRMIQREELAVKDETILVKVNLIIKWLSRRFSLFFVAAILCVVCPLYSLIYKNMMLYL